MNKGIQLNAKLRKAPKLLTTIGTSVLDQLRIKKVKRTLEVSIKTIFEFNTMALKGFTSLLDIAWRQRLCSKN